MDILPYHKYTQLLQFVSKIKGNINEWQLVDVRLTDRAQHNAPCIAHKLRKFFENREGLVFVCNSRDILALVRLGPQADIRKLSADIEAVMPEYSCGVGVMNMTVEGLAKFQIHIDSAEEYTASVQDACPLQSTRMERDAPAFMVIEDDMFIRSLVAKTFRSKGRVVEMDKTDAALEKYFEILPDILFLDIHLPDGSGMDILSEVLSFDNHAYVVMISSDTVKENILRAKGLGAKGFLAKNLTPQKLEEHYQKCPTVARA